MAPSSDSSFWAHGGRWVLAQSTLMVGVAIVAPVCRGGWRTSALLGIGIVLMSIGAAFGIAGAAVLGRNRTIFLRPREGSELIERGVYRLVRHPLYTSVVLLSFGWALFWASGAALVVAVGLALFLVAKARNEERMLLEAFPAYAAYKRRVKSMIPWLF